MKIPESVLKSSALNSPVVVPADDTLRLLNNFSFSIDVKFSGFRPGNFFMMNREWDSDGFYFQFDEDHLVLGFGDQRHLSQIASSTGLFKTGVWYRLSGVKDGTSARLFVDGTEVAVGSVAADIVDSPADFMIGSGDYTPAIAMGVFTFWSQPLTVEQMGAHALGNDDASLPVPMIRYLPTQSMDAQVQNSVSEDYPAVFVSQGAGMFDDDDTASAAASVDGVLSVMRGAALVVLVLTPLAVYGCGLGVTGCRRWTIGLFPLSLKLLSSAALFAALAVVVLRSETGLSLLKAGELQLSESITTFLEGGLLVFGHLLLLLSIALCFKLLTGDQRRFVDLFAHDDTGKLRNLSMLLIALGALAAFWIGAALIGLLSDPAAAFGLLAAPAVYAAALTLAAIVAMRAGKLISASENGSEAERRQMLDADVKRISAKLERALEDEDLYRNPDLTLRQLSDAVGAPEHRISEVLNQHLKTSFYDFVNGRRIDEAKQVLLRNRERTVLDIALEVGFNSKSTFYAAFKKVTGQSPAVFRRSASEVQQDGGASGDGLADDGSAT